VTASLQPPDAELVRACAARDLRALEAIYDRWHRPVLGLLLRMLDDRGHAEDILQEVFYEFWRTAGAGPVEHVVLPNWLFRRARHRAIDLVRQQGVRARTAATLASFSPEPGDDPAEETWLRLRNQEVRRALLELPDEERQVLTLCYFGGLTQSEVAAATGAPLGTVKTRARRGLQRLEAALRGEAWTDHPMEEHTRHG
jgi:RNA polymerase sigma-70 factor (ECF subfamily)